jgi:hypothetical protein
VTQAMVTIKWEYKVIPLSELDFQANEERLDYWGALGWELVTITLIRDQRPVATFKRPAGET